MKSVILLLAFFTAAFSSCTTAYKTGQTPDDVYYSPARPQEEYVQSEKEDRQNRTDEYYDDRYLRMKVRDRYRWSDLDDSYYYSRRYSYSSYNCCCFSNPWTPYSYWNNYYNPYYNHYTINTPTASAPYNKPRTFNLNAYNSNALTTNNYSNPKYANTGNYSPSNNGYPGPRNSNTNSNSNSGNIIRDIFRSSSSSSSSSNSSNNSSSSSSSTSPSSGSGSNGTTAPVRKF